MEWQQKRLWYGPATLDDRMSENVQNIRHKNQKIHQRRQEKLEGGINNRKKSFSRS